MTLHEIGQVEKGNSYSSVIYRVPCKIKLDNGEIYSYTISRSKLRDIKAILSNLSIGCEIKGLSHQGNYWLTSPFCNL